MKDFGQILAFRRAYHKLRYWESKMTISQLWVWVEKWCRENGLFYLCREFQELGLAYTQKECKERIIERVIKKRKD